MEETSAAQSNAQLDINEIVENLEQLQIDNDHKSVQNVCNVNVISFDRKNLTKFLESVYATLMKFPNEPVNQKLVLDFAKSQVNDEPCHELVINKNYETFEAFRNDVIVLFHDPEIFDELRCKTTSLKQSPDEDICHYGLRATQLRDIYKNELSMFYGEEKSDLEYELKMSEEFVTEFFMSGMIPFIRSFIMTVPTSLEDAIAMAIVGEGRAGRIY